MIAAASAALSPLRDLVIPRPQRPETVLTLENAVTDRLGTVRSFELPPSVKRHFEQVLDAVDEGRGRGFWVQSEYGGGKTHFIAAVTALLGQSPSGGPADAEVWAAVNDAEVRSRASRLAHKRLLPVAVSCKGIMPVDGQYARALLNLLMDGFARALADYGLAEQIPIRSEDELYQHYRDRPAELRANIDAWSRQQNHAGIEELYDQDPATAAGAYRRWCRDVAGAEPEIDEKVVEWLARLCRRLRAAGFDGLLVVIDEFATLQNLITAGPDVAGYEDVLEALGWLVPQKLLDAPEGAFGVYTIVASQKGHPTKLAQRFSNILLLAQNALPDYEIIVSRRVRTLRQDRLVDVDRYYHHHRFSHSVTYAGVTRERFREVFPFQPRVFQAIWDITAAGGDVAAARFGIAAVWDALKQPGVLAEARLLTVSDLLRSEQFQSDLKATPEYREAFLTFQAAQESAKALDFRAADAELAGRVLDALFVDYLASRRSPRRLSTQVLAEAVLAESASAVITPGDQVLTVLSRLKQLRQVAFDPATGAQFLPQAGGGPTPVEVINKAVAEYAADEAALADVWATLLTQVGSPMGLWSELRLDTPKAHKTLHKRIGYSGVLELRRSFERSPDLPYSSGRHFHIVVLTQPGTVAPEALGDPRVAVIIPGTLSEEEATLCCRYLACEKVLNDNALMTGANAGELRNYAQQQKLEAGQQLVNGQGRVYRRGRVVTKAGLALPAETLFRGAGWKDAVDGVVDALLGAAYSQLEQNVKPASFRGSSRFDPAADSGKVFAGLINGSTQPADSGAAQNFGPGLGLSRSTAPTNLALERERYGIAMILQRLAGTSHGVATEDLYDTLCAPPYGVPSEVVTLWLLACVRNAVVGEEGSHLELKLQRNARARLKTTLGPVPDATITFLNVKNLDWSTSLRTDFAQLRVSEEAPFGEVVAYAKVLNPTLKAPTEPEQVLEEERRLQHEMEQATERLAATRRQVQDLAGALGSALPAEAQQTLSRLEAALTVPGDYTRQQALLKLRETYPGSGGPEAMAVEWNRLQGWTDLASHGTDLATLHRTVQDLVRRLGRQPGRYAAVVNAAQDEVLPRFDLVSLLATPSAAESVLEAARAVRDAYHNEYSIHHRDYNAAVARLEPELAALGERARILGQLNKIKRAGAPVLTDAAERVAALMQQLRPCPRHGEAVLPIGGGLACSACGLDPLAAPPSGELEPRRREIESAIRSRVNAVKAAAIQQALADVGDGGIRGFLVAIQAQQLEGLLEVLSDELVAHINRVLDAANVVTVQRPLLQRLAGQYPTVQKAQVREVTAAFQRLLEETFAELERQQPDTAVQLQLFGE